MYVSGTAEPKIWTKLPETSAMKFEYYWRGWGGTVAPRWREEFVLIWPDLVLSWANQSSVPLLLLACFLGASESGIWTIPQRQVSMKFEHREIGPICPNFLPILG